MFAVRKIAIASLTTVFKDIIPGCGQQPSWPQLCCCCCLWWKGKCEQGLCMSKSKWALSPSYALTEHMLPVPPPASLSLPLSPLSAAATAFPAGNCWHYRYRIRPMSENEQTQRVSKEVKQIRDFENAFLKTYQAFLQTLNTCIKNLRQARRRYAQEHGHVVPPQMGREEKEMKRLASTAVLATQSLCQLLEYAPHFNYRNNIITVITPLMTGTYGAQVSAVLISVPVVVVVLTGVGVVLQLLPPLGTHNTTLPLIGWLCAL